MKVKIYEENMRICIATPIERIKEDHAKSRGRSFWCLLLLSVLASLVGIPFSRVLSSQSRTAGGTAETSILDLFIGSISDVVILGSLAIWLGLWVSARSNLGAPLLARLLSGESLSNLVERKVISTSILMGLAVGVVVFGLRAILKSTALIDFPEFEYPSALVSLFGALGASVSEEIIFRLGVMSLIVRLLQSLANTSTPSTVIIWTGNFVAALLFGVAHLPLVSNLIELTPAVVGALLMLNGLVGVTFGWLFWRYGLVMAMVAHFSTDIVLHVIAPLFFG